MANISESSKAKGSVAKPKFFKIMLGDFDHHLRVPRTFVKRFEETLEARYCKLKGPSGNEWRVQVSWEENDVMFSSGWSSFVKEHRLELGDFLVFTYRGNFTFKVFVFDKTGCEREEYMMDGGETIEENDTDCDENQVENENKRKSDLNGVYKGKSKVVTLRRGYLSGNEGDTDFSENRVENENRRKSDLNGVDKGKSKVVTLRRGYLSENKSDNDNVDHNGPSAEDNTSNDDNYKMEEDEIEASGSHSPRFRQRPGKQIQTCHVSSRRKVTYEEKEAARAKAGACVRRRKSIGVPVVGIILQRTHVYKGLYLTIPKDWAVENMVKANHDVELRVTGSDVYWLVGCRWTNSGQCQLRPKWAEFVFDNNLEEGDTCVFELVSKGIKNGKKKAAFKVRIFRVVEETTPLVSKRIPQ